MKLISEQKLVETKIYDVDETAEQLGGYDYVERSLRELEDAYPCKTLTDFADVVWDNGVDAEDLPEESIKNLVKYIANDWFDEEEEEPEETPDALKRIASRLERVNGPEYYGASYPKYNPLKVNESEFPHNIRLKYMDAEPSGNTIKIKWISQEDFDSYDAQQLEDEIVRTAKELAERASYTDPFKIDLYVEDRDQSGSEWSHIIEINK